jgi:hypothetical protein
MEMPRQLTHRLVEYNMARIDLQAGLSAPIGRKPVIVRDGPISQTLFNISLKSFLTVIKHQKWNIKGFAVMVSKEERPICVQVAAYADDSILHSTTRERIREMLGALVDSYAYAIMSVNLKKCVSVWRRCTDTESWKLKLLHA